MSKIDSGNIKELINISNKMRLELLNAIYHNQYGHPGGALSILDILVCLYFSVMKTENTPLEQEHDYLIMSKGHACMALYVVLANKGYFPKEQLNNVAKINSFLQGHPDSNKTIGVDFTSGSLGQGLSVGIGMAIAIKMKASKAKVFVISGDGELQEGQIWEAVIYAGREKINNLIWIIDYNKLQQTRDTCSVLDINSLKNIISEFGWKTQIINGHDYYDILRGFENTNNEKPLCVLADTIKGKGVDFMENNLKWHLGPIKEEDIIKIRRQFGENENER